MIDAVTTPINNVGEAGRSIVQHNATREIIQRVITQISHDTNQILSLDHATGMHQSIRQLTIGSEKQQTRSIEIQTSNNNPPSRTHVRQ